jgi:hypothetical protein
MVVELLAAGAVLVLLTLIGAWRWVRWRRSEVQVSVSEEEARENAAPLTRAILSESRRARAPVNGANGTDP